MKRVNLALLVLTLAALGAFARDEQPAATAFLSDELLPPVRLRAAGEFIDTGKSVAHSGPQLLDFDEDGRQDLLVGNFRGHIHVFLNIGSNREPVYGEGRTLEAAGETVKIPNW